MAIIDPQYQPRDRANKAGITYDETKSKILFAEDIEQIDDHIVSIEEFINLMQGNPQDYVQSRLQNLITNGNGLLGNNYNFSSYTFDPVDLKEGRGSFAINANHQAKFSNEPIPVNINKLYRLELWAKSGDIGGGNYNPSNIQYLGIVQLDADKLAITPDNYTKYPGSADAVLAQDLNPGDTQIVLNTASGWHNGTTAPYRNITWFGYTNSYGYTYPDYTYSRNFSHPLSDYNANGLWAQGGISGNTITLRKPWPGPALPAGTAVRNRYSGSTYKYIAASGVAIPNTWTKYSGIIGFPISNGVDKTRQFGLGTQYIYLMHLNNWHSAADNVVRLSGITLTELTQATEPPQLTTTERDAIPNPFEGLEIWNKTTHKKQAYNGSSWVDYF